MHYRIPDGSVYPFSPPRPAKTSPVIQAGSVPYKIKCVASGALCATGFRSEWKLYGTGWNARRGGGPRTTLTGPYSTRISRPHTRITVSAPSPSYPISLAVFCVSRIKGVMLAPGPLVATKEVERTVAICQKPRSRPRWSHARVCSVYSAPLPPLTSADAAWDLRIQPNAHRSAARVADSILTWGRSSEVRPTLSARLSIPRVPRSAEAPRS